MNATSPSPEKHTLSAPAPETALSPVALAAGATPPPADRDVSGYFDAYANLTRTLRGWLVVFGVGTPVVIASQSDLSKRLTDSGYASTVVALFLGGVALQIVATLLYKSCMWYCYRAAEAPDSFDTTWRYRFSHWVSEQFWLELLFDVVTIGCFVAAVFRLLRAVL